jgi:AcrR family transcriptional regulator
LDAALHVIAQTGECYVTMEAVAAAAGVTKPVVYGYFANRDELLAALIDRETRRAAAAIADLVPALDSIGNLNPDALLVDRMAAWLRLVQARPDTWRLILLAPEGAPRALREQVERGREWARQGLRTMLSWAMERRGGPNDLDSELAAHLAQAISLRAAELVLTDPDDYTPERVAKLIERLLTEFVRPPKARR